MNDLLKKIEKAILEYDESLRYKTKSASETFGNGKMYRYSNKIIHNVGNLAKAILNEVEDAR